MKIRAEKDFWSGLLFIAFAIVAIVAARGYSIGSVGRMGPGYFPLALGGLLALLGIIMISKSFVTDGERMEPLNLGPLAAIVTAVVLFGLSIERLGLVISIAIVTGVLAAVFRGLSWVGFVGLTGTLIAFSVVVFAYALQLPLTIWPAF
jgi:putative tricarboxylic transport membrane protein